MILPYLISVSIPIIILLILYGLTSNCKENNHHIPYNNYNLRSVISYENEESFKVINFEKKHNIICVFVCCHNNEDDYNFIKNNINNVDFFVINSCHYPNLYTGKIKAIVGEKNYITRMNIGWDTTAWKEFILDNYNEMKDYNYVILANNSCRYDFKITNLIELAKKYQFFGLNESNELNPHYQSYFIIIRKDLFSSNDFVSYWKNMPKINCRQDAINHHELKFMKHFRDKGYSIGKYLKEFVQVYDINSYVNTPFKVDFVKKTALEKNGNKKIYEKQLISI